MRKTICSATAMAGSAGLFVVGAPAASQAYTAKELSICWVNKVPGMVQDLEFVADGPSFKAASLDAGECVSWDVRPGRYKLTVEDVEEFLDAAQSGCEELPAPIETTNSPDLTIKIKRQGDAYKAWPEAAVLDGQVTTNVKKDRRTAVTVLLQCVQVPAPPDP